MKPIKDANVAEKRVIVWTDLDVPVKDGQITDDTRLENAVLTLKYLRGKNAAILMIGHLGRPAGPDPHLSLKPVAIRLGEMIGVQIELLTEIKAPSSKLTLLENIRFWPEEEAKDYKFSQEIARLGQIYVNDCFATSHHAGATMLYLPKLLPSYVGFSVEREIAELSKILKNPERPLVAIIGGAKIETKLPVIAHLAKIADQVLVGGKLMFEIGQSEREGLANNVIVATDDIDGKDIGPASLQLFSQVVSEAAMVVWNGPLGVFEEEGYILGTKKLAEALVNSPAYSVIGGGDTIAALNRFGFLDKISYVSAGGGAMLEFLAGKRLPGLEALGFYD